MLVVRLGYLGLLAGAAIAVSACSSSDSGSSTPGTAGSGSGGSAGAAACTDCVHPPDPSATATEGDGAGQTFAIKNLDLGGTTTDAWKSIGYDLDGKKSNLNSTDHCQLATGAPNHIKTDGNNGIDNSFGANVVAALPAETQGKVDDAMKAGEFTMLIQIDKLGAKTDYIKLPAALYAAGGRTAGDGGTLAPKWDGTDEWPVLCELMTDCKDTGTLQLPDNKSKVQFATSYMTGGTWVSGLQGEGTFALQLSVAGFSLNLTVHNAIISTKLTPGSPPTEGTNGIVAGILKTSEVLEFLKSMAGKINTSFCEGDTLQSFVDQVNGASDIMVDGTQDSTKTCDGISIGLGFTVGAAKVQKVLDKAAPSPDPCASVDGG